LEREGSPEVLKLRGKKPQFANFQGGMQQMKREAVVDAVVRFVGRARRGGVVIVNGRTVEPECPRCGRLAPDPSSAEADQWVLRTGDDDLEPVAVCSDCATPEGLQAVEDELRRRKLAEPFTEGNLPRFDAVVFVRGEPKPFGDCTSEDLAWLAEDAWRGAAQAYAWAQWIKANASRRES
jgi:hypothetical protein